MNKISKIKNTKITLIAMKIAMAVGVLIIIINIISLFGSKAATEKCTAAMWGVVKEVEDKHIHRHSTSYHAVVTPVDQPNKKFESIFTLHKYNVGDRVMICYDPEDISNYYIEYADPEAEGLTLILSSSALLIVLFILHTTTSRKYKKLCCEENTSS